MSTRWLISWYQWSFLKLFLLAQLGTRPLINLPDTFYFWKRISPVEQIYRSFHADWRQTPSTVSNDLDSLHWFDSYSIYRLLKGLSFTPVHRFHLANGACFTFNAVFVMSQTFCFTSHIDFFSDMTSNSQLEVQLHSERHKQCRHQKIIKHWQLMLSLMIIDHINGCSPTGWRDKQVEWSLAGAVQ